MNVAKWLLLAVLTLPLSELVAFIAVAMAIGFLWAFALVLASSVLGMLLLRHAGGSHISRVRVAMKQGNFTSLQADGTGGLILLAGILLLIPGFITDFIALLLFIGPLRRAIFELFRRGSTPARSDGVVDLEPEQWRQVPDPTLPNRRGEDDRR